mmetsp:Transcript_20320/g.45872  ORF Transcript_20320/g.45872 Transcript_20320/m.45872 type:complete len:536 (-) Transcript_20320:42-1649(-)
MGSLFSSLPAVDAIPDPSPLPGPKEDQEKLRNTLNGRLYTFDDNDRRTMYDEIRSGSNGTKTWNVDGMGKPAAIAACQSAADVSAAVAFCARHCHPHGVRTCVAGGRHSHQCMANGSFVIDLSGLKGITVNEAEGHVDVMGGSLQGDIDEATEPYGLATTAGHVASTGCGGLIVQGGHGYLERKFGMVIDNLLQVEMVVADGGIVVADEEQNTDLFWAIRGGGGNFGVVVRFRIRLHPVPGKIYAGQRIHAPLGAGSWFPDRATLVRAFSRVTAESEDDNATGLLVMPCGGPVIENLVYIGPMEDGEQYFAKHKNEVGYPLLDNMKGRSYHLDVQRFAPAGGGNFYMAGVLVPKMSDRLAEALGHCVTSANGPGRKTNCLVFVLPMGGAVSSKMPEDTAYPHRTSLLWVLIQGEWIGDPGTPEYEERRARVVAWCGMVKENITPFSIGHYGVLSEVDTHGNAGENVKDEKERTSAENAVNDGGAVGNRDTNAGFCAMTLGGKRNVYGPNLPRLRGIKKRYDPDNLFNVNDNILPE